MAGLKSIDLHMEDTKDLALLGSDDSIWIVVPVRWWDLSTLIWWFFVPFDKKRKVALTLADGSKVSFRAVRVASRHIRVRNFTAKPSQEPSTCRACPSPSSTRRSQPSKPR